MEKSIPKNVRQIGNVSDCVKLYLEDYVDTFINQYCENEMDKPRALFLVGEIKKENQNSYVIVSGAIQMRDIEIANCEISLGDETWKKACEECKYFFEEKIIVGWCLIDDGLRFKMTPNINKVHEKMFKKKNRVMMMVNKVDREFNVYSYKFNELMRLQGHYIYYEKNPLMQEYMIAKRKENCVTPSEDFEDRATKNFRYLVNAKEEKGEKRLRTHLAGGALVAMIMVLSVIGAQTYNGINTLEEDAYVFSGNSVEGNVEFDKGVSLEEEVLKEEEGTIKEISKQELVYIDTEAENVVSGDSAEEETGEMKELEEDRSSENISGSIKELYIVKEGDTLASISKQMYGTVLRVEEICEENGISKTEYIQIGQELIIP